jgi:hypothetical protein
MTANRQQAAGTTPRVRIPSLFEIFYGKLANWIRRIAQWRKQGLLKRAQQERRRRAMRIETLEPRLLLSADVTYGYTGGVAELAKFNDVDLANNNYILDFVDGAGNDEFRLRAENGDVLASGELDDDGVNTITITGSEELGDRLSVDLSAITGQDAANYDIEIIFNGGGYLLGALGQQDKVTVIGDGGYDMGAFSLTANGPGSALLDLDLVIAESDAVIEVAGSIVAESVNLSAVNTINLEAGDFLGLGSLKVAAMEVFTETRVSVLGTGDIQGGAGGVTLSATANITTVAEALSDAGGDGSVDAAIADTTIISDVIVDVRGAGNVASSGAAALNATNTVNATTTADGSAGAASKGASLGVGVVVGTTEASIEGSSTVSGSSITLAATTTNTVVTDVKAADGGAEDDDNAGTQSETQQRLGNPDDDGGTDDAASTGEGDLGLAGALAVNDITSATRAFISSTGSISTAGALNVTATSTNTGTAKADGSTVGGGSSGVGVAVAINVADIDSEAYIIESANIVADAVSVKSLAPSTSTFKAEAISGAGNTDEVGVAGSLAINVVFVDSTATLRDNGGGSIAVGGADVTLEAHADTDSTAKATSAQDGGDEATGIGASVALNITENDTRAAVENGVLLTGAHDLSMVADGKHEATTEAKGGTSGGTAITPVAGITYTNHNTEVLVGTGSLLTLGGALDAEATHSGKAETTAEGETQGSDVAIGASFALTIANDSVAAALNRSATTGGAASLSAHGASSSKATAKASAAGAGEDDGSNDDGVDDQSDAQRSNTNNQATSRGGSSSGTETPSASSSEGSVSVAAAVAINIADAQSTASIASLTSLTANGKVTVSTESNTDAAADADGSAASGGGDAAIGAAVAINKADVSNTAAIGDATVLADGVDVKAKMHDVSGDTRSRPRPSPAPPKATSAWRARSR